VNYTAYVLIGIAGGILIGSWIIFLLINCIPKIVYFLIFLYFVGVLAFGFFSLKYAQLRGTYMTTIINKSTIVIAD
jgi:hypothetical protein